MKDNAEPDFLEFIRDPGMHPESSHAIPPQDADAYLLKHIIHNWDDERATTILSNCRKAIRTDGKLLVMDCVVGPSNQPDLAKFLDLKMLAVAGGLERSQSDWHRLLAKSGFRFERIIPTSTPESILEGTPTSGERA